MNNTNNGNLGLQYGVLFDVETGGNAATEQIKSFNKKWQDMMRSNPIKIDFFGGSFGSVGNMDKVNTSMQSTSAKLKEMSDYYKELEMRSKLFYNANQSDKNIALDGMKKRLLDIKKEVSDIEYNLIGITEKKKPRAETSIQLGWISELKKEEAQLKAAMSALNSMKMGGGAADISKSISDISQTNFGLLQMRESYKQLSIEADRFAKANQKALNVEIGKQKPISLMSESDANAVEQKLQKLYSSLNRLNLLAPKIGLDDSKMGATLQRTLNEVNRLEQKLTQLRSSFGGKNLDDLLKFNPKNMNEANALMSELTKRRAELNRTDANYISTITSINRKYAEMSSENQRAISIGSQKEQAIKAETIAYQNQSNVISNLKQMAATYISLYEGIRLVKSIAEVTGQFEMQQRSLEALLQNADKAREIFSQTKALAVVSPYQFKDLLSYTKQLAAYRIETDELFGTMKKLADVSSGLGVDMNRIILAYGQVSAASVLRGQELRQFTEAGIPLVSLLADKFGELEGRTVSTGEVFDKISKRLVPFEMIKDIFGQMTSEGGIFFNMQEVQAETLEGKISNLKDAYQIMFNSIGSSETINAGLKGTVDLLMEAAKNWQGIAISILPLITVIGTYKGVMLGVNAIQKAQISYYGINEAYVNKQLADYERQIAAENRKTASISAGIAIRNAKMVTEQADNILTGASISLIEKENIKRTVRNLVLRAGSDSQKLSNAQNEIAVMLTARGIAADQAAIMSRQMFTVATTEAAVANKGLWVSMMTNPFGWIMGAIGLVVTLGAVLYEAFSGSNKLRDDLIKIDAEGANESSRAVARFSQLADTISKTNENTKEHQDALGVLKNTYKDMLPAQMLTTEGIVKLGGAYENATKAIEEYVMAKTKEKEIEAVRAGYEESGADIYKGLVKNMQESGLTAGEAKAAIARLQTQIETGKFAPREGTVDAWVRMKEIVAEMTGKRLQDRSTGFWAWAETTNQRVGDLTRNLTKAKSEINDIENGFDPLGLVKKRFNYASVDNDIRESLSNTFQKSSESPYQFNQRKIEIETEKLKNFLVSESSASMKEVQAAIDGNPIKFDDAGFQALWDSVIKRIQDVNPDRFTKDMNDMIQGLIPVMQKSDAIYNSLTKNSKETSTDYLSRINDEYKENLTLIQQAKKAIENKSTQKSTNGNTWEDELTQLTKVQKIRKAILDSQGMLDEKKKGSKEKDPRVTALEDEIKLIEDAKKKYDELIRAGMSADKAKAKIQELYGSKMFNGKTASGLILAYNNDDLVVEYKKYVEVLKKLPKTQKITFEAFLRINDIQVDEMVRKLKMSLKAVEDEFNTSKKRINIFDSIFESTGDANLANMIATSFEGEGIYNMKSAVSKALKDTFDVSFKDSGFDPTKLFDENGMVDFVKAQQEILKLTDGDKKASAQRQLDITKEYQQKEIEALLKGLQKFDDFESKRTDIIRTENNERLKIQSNTVLPQNVKDELMASSMNRERQGLAKIAKDQFKDSELWQTVFSDLDRVSNESIELLKDKIREYINTAGKDLAPTEMKEMIKTLDDLQKRTATFDLAKTLKVAFSKIDLEPLRQKAQEANDYYMYLKGLKDEALNKSMKADDKVNRLKADPNANPEEYNNAVREQTQATNELSVATKKLNDQEVVVNRTTKQFTDASNEKKKVMHDSADSVNADIKSMNALKGAVGGAADAFYAVADAMGLTIDPTTKAIIDAIVKSIGAMVAILSAVAAVLMLVDVLVSPLLIVAGALAAIVASIAIIRILSLKSANDEIEKQAQAIKRLEREYNALENKMKSALGTDYIKLYNKEVENLTEKITSAQKQLNAEKSKGKDSDKDKIAEYEDTVIETQQAIIDKQREFESAIVGADLTSAAKDFASSWLDAYDSFGDTKDAISAKFKELMREMVVSTMLSKVMDVYLAPVYDLINDAGKDGVFSVSEVGGIKAAGVNAIANADAAANVVMEGLGDFGKSLREGTSNLSGVSKGISTVTEETATILGGYLDSIRFRLFAYFDLKESDTQISTGIAALMLLQSQQVTHLAEISSNTLRTAVASEELTVELKKVISVTGNKAPFSISVEV